MPVEDDPMKEIFATGALILVLGAIIGGVIGAMELGQGSVATAIIAWVAAAVGFGISLAYFMTDARKSEQAAAELPFPCWLRTEPESAL